MSHRRKVLSVFVVGACLAGACSKKEGGGGEGSAGVVGKKTPQEHENPRGTFTVKGPMPEAWKPRTDVMGGMYMALAHLVDDMPEAQLAIGLDYVAEGQTPEADARKRAGDKGTKPTDDHVVVGPLELEPGRWGYVLKNGDLQWRPGIYMFEAHAVWKVSDRQVARCWVSWKGKSADGALDLCKQLEVTPAAAP